MKANNARLTRKTSAARWIKGVSSVLLLGSTGLMAQNYPDWHPLYRPYVPAPRPASKARPAQPSGQQPAVALPAEGKVAPVAAPAGAEVKAAPGVVQPQPGLTEPQAAVIDAATPAGGGRARKHEVAVSGDFMFGQGTVSVPFGYSIAQSVADVGGAKVPVGAFSADRSSTYFGGTISYAYARAWAVDVSYAQGNSSGQISVPTEGLGSFPADFTIDDQWFQIYGRYTFPALRGKPVSAYLRLGATIVQADIQVQSLPAVKPNYFQENTSQDILGNIGAGLSYDLHRTRHFRIALSGEAEGFGGVRSQEVKENLGKTILAFKATSIDNTVYGGIARGTVRFDYAFGETRALKASAEGGIQVRYTLVDYPESGGSQGELLWGPYVKVGVRYEF